MAFTVKPKITGFTPLKATGGSTLVITGTGLGGTTTVDFPGHSGAAVTPTATATTVKVAVPMDATTGTITTNNGTDSATSVAAFTPLPVISSFNPPDGAAGSTVVTITGGELQDATAVRFGTMSVAPSSPSATSVQATVPIGFSSGMITVVTPEGSAVSKTMFAVTKVASISPTSAKAGATVTITGQGLSSATTVDFQNHAGVPVLGTPTATAVKVVVPNDATTGALTVNTARAHPTTPSFKPLPAITSLSVVDGQAGDNVTVTGTNLLGATTVKFGTATTTFDPPSATSLTAAVPGTTFSSGAVSITTPAGIGTSTQIFQITKVTGVTPTLATAGATLTLTGQGLASATSVDFQNHAAVPVLGTPTATTVKVVVPNDATTGVLTVNTPRAVAATPSFKPLPKITSLSIVDGGGGDHVQVTGTNLLGPTAVKFGTYPALSLGTVTATGIDTQVPNVPFSSGTVSVTTPAGTAISTQIFQVTKVTGITPTLAAAGTTVTITGQGLGDAQTVDFPNHAGVVPTSATATSIKVVVPGDAIAGQLTVHMPDGMTPLTPLFKPLPKITNLSVVDGIPGDPVHVTGTNLLGASAVKFGTVSAVAPTGVSATGLDTIVPNAFLTSGAVSVTTPAGTAVSTQIFQITKVTGVTPTLAAAGATLTITGQGLGDAQTVDFPGHSGIVPSFRSATSLKVLVPPDAVDGPLTVRMPDGDAPTTPTFKPLPRITSVDQPGYQVGSGTTVVTVTGTNLQVAGSTTAKLGSVSVTPAGIGPTGFHFTLPANAVTGAITYTDAAGTTTSAANLVKVLPTIDPLATTNGTVGAHITLTGKTFTGTVSVKFGSDTHAAPFTVGTGGTSLAVTVPSTAASGPIAVTNAGGTTLSASFTVLPVITSFTPTSGSVGATLTVTGSGFIGATQVDFGGGVNAAPTNVTANSLKVVVPPGATNGSIMVETSSAGTSAASATNLTVTFSVTSSTHSAPYGGVVHLQGVGLTGVTSVQFNGVPAAGLTPIDDGHLDVTVPGSGTLNGTITITKGTTIAAPGSFTLLTMSAPSDTAGLVGAQIRLNGTGFNSATSVTFNGFTAGFVANNDDQITTTVPSGATSGPIEVTTPGGSVETAFTVEANLDGVVINEVRTDSSGFIELYNSSGGTLDLTGAKLVFRPAAATDSSTDMVLTTIGAGATIASDGFYVFDIATLDITGGGLALELPNSTMVDSMGYGTATNGFVNTTAVAAPAAGHSVGLATDGVKTGNDSTDYKDFSSPTPGAPNS